MTSNLKNRIIVLIGILISIAFLFFAFQGLQPEAFIGSLSDINLLWIIIAAATYSLAVTVIAWRWQFLLRGVKFVPLIPLTQIVAVGYMGNNVYPLRAGEALRIFLLKRNHDMPVIAATTTVFVERVFDGIVMLSFILIGLLLVDVQSEQIQLVASIATPIFVIAVIVFFTLAAFPKLFEAVVERVASFLPETIAKIVLSLSNEILTGLSGLRSPLFLAGAILTSYATWAIEAGVYWIVMWAFGLEFGYPVALLVVGTVNRKSVV